MGVKMSIKHIYDPIHGFIELSEMMIKIIDTFEFQRLRDLKQLGAVHFVYPSATHTRFEHSLGVCHLSKQMSKKLFGDEIIPKTNRFAWELISIAGLIHDIGHGPFSHLYDNFIRKEHEPEHEERGCEIFREMVKKYKLDLSDNEVNIIIDMVNPPEDKHYNPYYQIVANKVNQIDVDKIDYIQRDCYHIGLQFGGEWSRLLTMCEVTILESPNVKLITWPKKLEYEIFQLFSTRYRLHKQVYNHHTVKAYEYLISELLKDVDVPFIDLTDSIINTNKCETLNKIKTRNIPKLVEEKILTKDQCAHMNYLYNEGVLNLSDYPTRNENIIIDIISFGFASSDKNPLSNVYLHDNKNSSIIYPIENIQKTHKQIIWRKYVT